MKYSKALITAMITTGVFCAGQASAHDWKGEAKDAWIDGKIESSYLINTELNNFNIDTNVDEGVVMLSGTVPSDVHKDLAEAIASNIEGVNTVKNDIVVDGNYKGVKETSKEFGAKLLDMTTTARLKTIYALNDEIKAKDINIDTMDGEVTLEGEVSTTVEKLLAEEIAMGLDSVMNVNNKLTVSKS